MPRIRSIPPEVCELEALARVSSYADRTFVRLWCHADDDGRTKDNPRLLRAQLYPLDDRMTVERVERDLAELEAENLLQRYTVDSKRYLQVDPEVWAWQKPRRKVASKLPPPPRPDIVRTPPDIDGTCAAGGGDGGGVGDGEGGGVTPNSREPRELAPSGNPQVVDFSTHPLAVKANRHTGGVA